MLWQTCETGAATVIMDADTSRPCKTWFPNLVLGLRCMRCSKACRSVTQTSSAGVLVFTTLVQVRRMRVPPVEWSILILQ